MFDNAHIVNLGRAAAGNEFIARSVIDYVHHNPVDQVFILWSGLRRLDEVWPRSTKSQFSDCGFTGETTHGHFVFSGGNYSDLDEPIWKNSLIDGMFKMKYCGNDDKFLFEQSALWIMLCQTVLSSLNKPYNFSFIYNPFDPIFPDEPSLGSAVGRDQGYFACLDWSRYVEPNPLDWAIANDVLSQDLFHPTEQGMSDWAQHIRKIHAIQ